MTAPSTISALLISDQAEDVKRITVGLRNEYRGGHIEAVYTADQALEWASRHPWLVIIIDLELPDASGFLLIQKLRTLSPRAGIIIHSQHRDISPLQAMRSGAAALLHRQTPSFLNDLLAVTDNLIRSSTETPGAEPGHAQYLQLVEARGGILYELNSDGRFTYISTTVRSFLGYDARELLGTHYSTLLHSESKRLAEQRFNERRAGARATRKLELRLVPKARIGLVPDLLPARVSARGLYAAPEMFLGTVGLIQGEQPPPSRSTSHPLVATPQTITGHDQPSAAGRDTPTSAASIESVWEAIEHFLGRLEVAPTSYHAPLTPARKPQEEALSSSLQSMDIAPLTLVTSPIPSSVARVSPSPPPVALGSSLPPSPTDTDISRPEHRHTPRYPVDLPSDISCSGETWSGVTTNLGVGGLCVDLPRMPVLLVSQSVTVSLVSDVLFLQLDGTATTEDSKSGTRVRVNFGAMDEVKRTVLLSFLEVLRDRPDCLKVHLQVPIFENPGGRPSPDVEAEVPPAPFRDRRLDARVPCQISVQLLCRTPHGVHTRFTGSLQDLHLRGARLRTQETLPTRMGDCWMEIPVSMVSGHAEQRTSGTPEPTTHYIPLEVVREAGHGGTVPSRASLTWHYGVRFGHLEDQAAGLLSNLVNHAVLAHMASPAYRMGRTIITELLFTHNPHDRRIAIYHDYMDSDTPGLTPLIVIVPEFGRTKEEYLPLAYFLAAQGFHILRYDPTNHVGESDGRIAPPLLSQLQTDLKAVLGFIEEFWPGTPILLIGDGIGGRLGVRLLQSEWWIVGVGLINLPLDLSDELHALHHTVRDPFKATEPLHAGGHFRGVKVSTEVFIQDAITSRYVSAQDLLHDLSGVTVPIAFFAPLEDMARQHDLLEQVRAVLGSACKNLSFVSEPRSSYSAIPPRPESWVHKLAAFCMSEARHGHLAHVPISAPDSDILLEHKLERLRTECIHRWTKAVRQVHWSSYVDHCQRLFQSSSYRRMLGALSQTLTSLRGNQRVLEVGCGNADLATFLLAHRAHHPAESGTASFQLPEYVGLDFSGDTLISARNRMLGWQSSLSRDGAHVLFGGRNLTPLFAAWELDAALPFISSHFDVVVVNLVFGHFANPLLAIREFWRVLLPGGRLLVVAPKTTADLSSWYQNTVLGDQTVPQSETESDHIEDVLSGFQRGWTEGSLRRFSYQDLAAILASVHGIHLTIDTALDDQLFIASAQKL